MERAYRTEVVVDQEGGVRLRDLPFGPGEIVDVIVLTRTPQTETPQAETPQRGGSLTGTLLHYDDPTEPVAVEDWDVLK